MRPDLITRLERYLSALGDNPGRTLHEMHPDVLIREALEALRAEQWRPIDMAPTDGTPLLLWCNDWVIGHHAVSYPPYAFEGWTTGWETAGGYDVGYARITPTHWRPLPEPPAQDTLDA